MLRYLISFMKQLMEARVIRLDLLMQQAERKQDLDKCCDAIPCCLNTKKKSTNKPDLNYYFHK